MFLSIYNFPSSRNYSAKVPSCHLERSSHQPCHLERSSHQSCHLERSAAESKDLTSWQILSFRPLHFGRGDMTMRSSDDMTMRQFMPLPNSFALFQKVFTKLSIDFVLHKFKERKVKRLNLSIVYILCLYIIALLLYWLYGVLQSDDG